MSGTSLDGIDAVLMRQPDPASSRMQIVDHHFVPMPHTLRLEFLALQSPQENELHRSQIAGQALIECYAQAIAGLLQKTGIDPAQIAAIGAHGQTIRHQPGSGYSIQLNAPHALAEATGISLNVAVDDARQDISNALLALGYNEKEAAAALKQLPPDIGTSDGIRQALKLLSKV